MTVKENKTGVFVNEQEIISVQLTNDKGNYVTVLNYGTIIQKFVVKNSSGKEQDIVLGFDHVEGYLNKAYLETYPYMGAIIGRYANRIKDARFSIDGEDYFLAKNNGENCLHGGNEGFDRKVWNIVDTGDSPYPSVTFEYFSLDGEEEFPGDLAIQLTLEFTNNDELILSFQADTDEATPINLTHHGYFNLSENIENVKDHVHQMNASFYLEQDDNSAVTGRLLPVDGTGHDFRHGKSIGEGWDDELGYDQTYVIDKEYGDLTLMSKTTESKSGLSLLVYSTEPVAHLYTAKFLSVKNGKGGKDYNEFDAFCVETQHHPNAINIAEFPNTILRPEEVYTQTTIYKVII